MPNPALDAKVRALQKDYLSVEDFKELIEKETVHEVFSFLKDNTHYGVYFSGVQEEDINRTSLENTLEKIIETDTDKLLYFVLGADRNFLRLVLQGIHLNSFVILLRGLLKNRDLTQIVENLPVESMRSKFDFNQAVAASDWKHFKDSIKDPAYKRAVDGYEELTLSNLFEVEKTLQRVYYDQLVRYLKKINSGENAELVRLIRKQIDIENLIWIYRAKKFYDLRPEEILSFIYLGGKFLSPDRLRDLAMTESLEEFLDEVGQYQDYRFLFDTDSKLSIERRYKRYMHEQFRRLLYFSGGLTLAYSYLELLKDEISDLISIIEAKRYRLDSKEIDRFLIRQV